MSEAIQHVANSWPNAVIAVRSVPFVRFSGLTDPNHRLVTVNNIVSRVVTLLKEKEVGLRHRLQELDWGRIMGGQTEHYWDFIHPLPRPGSTIFGQMLFTQLKIAVEG